MKKRFRASFFIWSLGGGKYVFVESWDSDSQTRSGNESTEMDIMNYELLRSPNA